ncbi:MAG TPA: LLM class flavin-dependent oxidoreductase [Alphaproteobacteria bacterium]|nr:LLM class flavin-dependent oxidoreductase [Alphaproteobacteria bacterium]
MQFAVFDHIDRGAVPLDRLYEERLHLAGQYDAAGFRALHVAEHHGTPLGMAPSPNLFLAALAQRTRRLRFGPLVYCLPYYHPLRLLEEICMLEQMSGGRLELGVGRGISPFEGAYYGLDYETAAAQYREALQLILQGLASERLSFQGRFYRVADMAMELWPVQRPHPPLWNGISRPDSAAWPAQQRVSVVTNHAVPMARQIFERYRAEWRGLGRDETELPFLGMARHIVVAETEKEALAIGRRAYPLWKQALYKLWVEHGSVPVGLVLPDSFDELVADGRAIAGRPDRVAETVERQLAESGTSYFLCRFAFGDTSYDEASQSAALFQRHVLQPREAAG